jgi:hypothetical protein
MTPHSTLLLHQVLQMCALLADRQHVLCFRCGMCSIRTVQAHVTMSADCYGCASQAGQDAFVYGSGRPKATNQGDSPSADKVSEQAGGVKQITCNCSLHRSHVHWPFVPGAAIAKLGQAYKHLKGMM